MTDQQQQAPQQPAPTAMSTAVEFSMAWLGTQGDIGKMVQRTLMTALQDNDQLQQVLQGQTQELGLLRRNNAILKEFADLAPSQEADLLAGRNITKSNSPESLVQPKYVEPGTKKTGSGYKMYSPPQDKP